jgi:hypothetical protein
MARGQHGFSGVYNASNLTLTDGEGAAIGLDVSGRVIIGLGGANAYAVDDSAMPATPAIMPIGGEYRSSATTYTDGDATVLQTDVNGNLKATLATQIAGEDLTNDVIKTEQRFSLLKCTADTAVKSGAGFVHTLTFSCNDAAPTAGSIIVYDNTAESGTELFNHTFTTTPFVPFSVILDGTFSTGLYVGFTTTADVNVTVSYR